MPLKWKLYYTCAMYILLWNAAFFLYNVFTAVSEGANAPMWQIILVLAGPCIWALKGVFSLRALLFYSRHLLLSKSERGLFVVLFGFNALFFLIALWISIFVIVPAVFGPYDGSGDFYITYEELAVDCSFFILAICSVWLAVFDLILLRAIKKPQ